MYLEVHFFKTKITYSSSYNRFSTLKQGLPLLQWFRSSMWMAWFDFLSETGRSLNGELYSIEYELSGYAFEGCNSKLSEIWIWNQSLLFLKTYRTKKKYRHSH